MADRLSSTSLLKIKSPIQMSSSDQCYRIKARTRPCLRKREENYSLDLTSYSYLSAQPVNDSVTSLWLSTQSLFDSSSERIPSKKCVSFSEVPQRHSYSSSLNEHDHNHLHHQQYQDQQQDYQQLEHKTSQRQQSSSTLKHSFLSRATRSVPNIGPGKISSSSASTESPNQKTKSCSRLSVELHAGTYPMTITNSSCLLDEPLEDKEPRTRSSTTRSESRVTSIFSKNKSSHKTGRRSFSKLSLCFHGEDTDLEQSFEEFCRNKQLATEPGVFVPPTRPDGRCDLKSKHNNTSKFAHTSKNNFTNKETSAITNSRPSHASESAHAKSRSEIILPLLKPMLSTDGSARPLKGNNSSDLDLDGEDGTHMQRLSFDDSCDSEEETRPLDQSMSEFIQTADIDNLASFVEFFDKVVNKSRSRVTKV